ncbi:MAG: hypothetical protein O3A84_03090, partial [Proteobacteria bacterium]|nr:hypothetical protein [Pseudomonadota bacterium]
TFALVYPTYNGFIGKDWGVGNTKWVSEYTFSGGRHAVGNLASWTGNNVGTANLYLYGSNTLPTAWNDGTLLSSHEATPNTPSTAYTVTASGLAENYFRYHWSAANHSFAEAFWDEITWSEMI